MLLPETGTTTTGTTIVQNNHPRPQNHRKTESVTQNQKMEPPNPTGPKVAETGLRVLWTWALFAQGQGGDPQRTATQRSLVMHNGCLAGKMCSTFWFRM